MSVIESFTCAAKPISPDRKVRKQKTTLVSDPARGAGRDRMISMQSSLDLNPQPSSLLLRSVTRKNQE